MNSIKKIKVQINGKINEINKEITITDLLNLKKINISRAIVEYNKKVLPNQKYGQIKLQDNDVLEILQMVAGG